MKGLFFLFSQLFALCLAGQQFFTSSISENDLGLWADLQHKEVERICRKAIESKSILVFDSLKNPMSQNDQGKLFEDSLEITYDSYEDDVYIAKAIAYWYYTIETFVFDSTYVFLKGLGKKTWILKKQFEELLDAKSKMYLELFIENKQLYRANIPNKSRAVIGDLNYELRELSYNNNITVYKNDSMTSIHLKETIIEHTTLREIEPKYNDNKLVVVNNKGVYDTTYFSSENLDSIHKFKEIFFAVNTRLEVSALSAGYYWAFGGVMLEVLPLGFMPYEKVVSFLPRKKELFNFFISEIIFLKLNSKYCSLMETYLSEYIYDLPEDKE